MNVWLKRRTLFFATILVAVCSPFEACFAASTYVIGQTIALTGSQSEHGRAVVLGIQIYLDQINAEGGVRGHLIELQTLDDGGDGPRAAENSRVLATNPEVLALFAGAEGGPCTASLAVANEKKIPHLACLAGSPELRTPPTKYSFPMRAPHLAEFEKLIETSLQFGMTRIAFLHSEGGPGPAHLANVTRILKARGHELALAIPLGSKPNIDDIAREIANKNIQVVFNHGSYSTYAQIIKKLRPIDPNVHYMAVNSGAQQMVRALGDDSRGLIFTQVVPLPTLGYPPVLQEFREALTKRDPTAVPTFSSLEGYLSAKLLVAALRQAPAKLTRAGFAEILENLPALDLGGFVVNVSHKGQSGPFFVDTVLVSHNGRFVR